MPFQKGYIPWNKGLKGFNAKDKHYRWKGGLIKKMCVCGKDFLVVFCKKDIAKYCSRACADRKPAWNRGLKGLLTGENNGRWVKDRTKLSKINEQGERRTSAYVIWRKQIYIRDNFKCRINNEDCEGRIEAHHILGWTDYPELRYEINNGITLCHAHHPRKRAEEKQLAPFFMGLIETKV